MRVIMLRMGMGICAAALALAACDWPTRPGLIDRPILYARYSDPAGGLYRIDVEGRSPERVATLPAPPVTPVYSPDGTRIALSLWTPLPDQRPDTAQIYLLDADGTNLRRLVDGFYRTGRPAWSPDGRSLAFWYQDHDIRTNGIATIGPGGSVLRLPGTEHANIDAISWSADGEWIAFARGVKLWMVPAGGGVPIQLVPDTVPDARSPRFSPDGRYLAYAALDEGEERWEDPALFITPVGEFAPRRVVASVRWDYAWSPDGTKIVYAGGSGADHDLYVVDIATGQTSQLTSGTPPIEASPDWRR